MEELDTERKSALNEIGNIVHSSCVIASDEAQNGIVRTFGESGGRKKYSQVGFRVQAGLINSPVLLERMLTERKT